MNKIKPLTVDEIKYLVARYNFVWLYDVSPWENTLSLIVTWAHAEARARYNLDLTVFADELFRPYLNEVLDEIGWPQEQR